MEVSIASRWSRWRRTTCSRRYGCTRWGKRTFSSVLRSFWNHLRNSNNLSVFPISKFWWALSTIRFCNYPLGCCRLVEMLSRMRQKVRLTGDQSKICRRSNSGRSVCHRRLRHRWMDFKTSFERRWWYPTRSSRRWYRRRGSSLAFEKSPMEKRCPSAVGWRCKSPGWWWRGPNWSSSCRDAALWNCCGVCCYASSENHYHLVIASWPLCSSWNREKVYRQLSFVGSNSSKCSFWRSCHSCQWLGTGCY